MKIYFGMAMALFLLILSGFLAYNGKWDRATWDLLASYMMWNISVPKELKI